METEYLVVNNVPRPWGASLAAINYPPSLPLSPSAASSLYRPFCRSIVPKPSLYRAAARHGTPRPASFYLLPEGIRDVHEYAHLSESLDRNAFLHAWRDLFARDPGVARIDIDGIVGFERTTGSMFVANLIDHSAPKGRYHRFPSPPLPFIVLNRLIL